MSNRRRDNRSELMAAAVSVFVYVNNEENGPTSLLKASEYDEKQVYFNCSCMSDSGLHFRTGHKV